MPPSFVQLPDDLGHASVLNALGNFSVTDFNRDIDYSRRIVIVDIDLVIASRIHALGSICHKHWRRVGAVGDGHGGGVFALAAVRIDGLKGKEVSIIAEELIIAVYCIGIGRTFLELSVPLVGWVTISIPTMSPCPSASCNLLKSMSLVSAGLRLSGQTCRHQLEQARIVSAGSEAFLSC